MNQPVAAQPNPLVPTEETLLRRSYDQLQTALSIGMIATWFWDISTDKVVGDLNLLRLFGVNEHDGIDGLPLSAFTNAIHPEDQQRVISLIEEAIRSGNIYEAEYRISLRGQTKWVLARGQGTYTSDNQPLTLSGV